MLTSVGCNLELIIELLVLIIFFSRLILATVTHVAFVKLKSRLLNIFFTHAQLFSSFGTNLLLLSAKGQSRSIFNPSYSLIIFGCRDKIFHFILLIAKYDIYTCKYAEGIISLKAFLLVLKSYFAAEKYAALIEGK